MFIDINSLKIKLPGGNYVNLGNFNNVDLEDPEDKRTPIALIVEAKYGFNKLWSEDSGRNLAGTMSGTLKGIFPKIIVQFKKLNKTEFEAIAPILDSPKQIVSYYDPYKKTQVEMETYTGDYEITNKDIVDDNTPNEGFSISFIAIRKRS